MLVGRCFLAFGGGVFGGVGGQANAEGGCDVALGEILIRDGDAVAVAHGGVVRRHDFDSGFVEFVLNILVQVRVDAGCVVGNVGEGVELVVDVEVVERRLEDEGLGVGEDVFCCGCCGEQKLVDDAPGSVVADGDGGVEDEAFLLGRSAEVHDVTAEHHGVCDGDFDVLDGAKTSDEERALYDVADGVGHLYAVAYFEGTHVGEDDACNDICYRRG